MSVSTHLDPVIGLDLHIVGVTVPPSPVPIPTPVPMPHVGMVFDPAGLAVGSAISMAISSGPGLVTVNGVPVTNTGTASTTLLTLPHTPAPGVTFVPPSGPGNDASLIFGSLGVTMGGSLAVRLGDIAMSCSNPVRMPTSMVLAVPKGPPVVVLRPMVPDLKGMAIAAAIQGVFKMLGKAVRAGGKFFAMVRRGTSRSTTWGKIAGALHKAVDRIAPKRFRDRMHRGVCFVTGHPVDVANGRVFTDHVDFELTGPLPLPFERVYSSSLSWRDGPLGYGWSHSLDQAVWCEEDKIIWLAEDGREIEFLVDGELRKGSRIYEPTNRLTLIVRGKGRWTIETAEGIAHEFASVHGDESGRAKLLRMRTREGHSIKLTYDDRGRLFWVTDSAGRRVRFVHDGRGKLREVWLPAPHEDDMVRSFKYEIDAAGDLVQVSDVAGALWRFQYKGHLLVKETDRIDVSFFFQYDGHGPYAKCVRTWGSQGIYDHEIGYNVNNRKTVVQDNRSFTTVYELDGLGMVIAKGNGYKTRAAYAYDPESGQLAEEVDPLGRVTRRRFDAHGNCAFVKGPDGIAVEIDYDEMNLPVRAQDTLGRAWRWEHDKLGRLTEAVNPLGERQRFGYKGGLLAWAEDARGARAELSYNGHKDLVEVREPGKAITRYAHDRRGQVLRVEDRRGGVTRYARDLQGRVTEVQSPVGVRQEFVHDAEGNILFTESPTRAIGFRYCGFHWMGLRGDGQARQLIEYDTEGNPAVVVNEAGERYTMKHDGDGLLMHEFSFDGQHMQYVRNLAGQVYKAYGPHGKEGRATMYEHDHAGRLTRIDYEFKRIPLPWDALQRFAEFSYGADGLLASGANENGTVWFDRDKLGRVVREVRDDVWIESRYGLGGLRELLTSSLGARMAVLHDGRGDVAELHVGRGWEVRENGARVRFVRDAGGLEVARELPGGVRVVWERDQAGRPKERRIERGGVVLDRREYRWAGDDQIASIVDAKRGTRFYRHDDRGRLIAAWNDALDVEHRAMDAVGNVFRKEDRSDRKYGPGGVLLEADGATYVHDGLGRLTEKRLPSGEVWQYAWYAAGMLREVVRPDGRTVRFAYDAFGRRIRKTVLRIIQGIRLPDKTEVIEAITRYVWDGDVLLHEIGPDGEVVTWYHEPESFAPVAKEAAGKRWYVVPDHLGTPTELVDEEGRICWQGRMDLWGRMTEEIAETGCPIRWPGQYEDAETGLYYNRWRYYDPEVGRYINQDPSRLQGGLNLYSYVDDPMCWIDPLGLAAAPIVWVGTIHEAKSKASEFAGVARVSKGGEPIQLGELNESSRGPAFRALNARSKDRVASGKTPLNLGRRNPEKPSSHYWMVHPDGHPDDLKPEHHAYPHVHASNSKGEERIFAVRKGRCK